MTTRYLVIHLDTSGAQDVAEVASTSAQEAVVEVQSYPDTQKVLFAVAFEDEPPKIYGIQAHHNAFMDHGRVVRIGATEGDALEEAAEDLGGDPGKLLGQDLEEEA